MSDAVVPLLTSPVIPAPFRHGFSTRAGGVSGAPFHTLNLGMKWGDERANVLENRHRLLCATGARTIYLASQVHGAHVLQVRATDDPRKVAHQEADGVCSDVEEIAVAVYVADCVPALFADPRTGACAAVHAGWRGTISGILSAAVAKLVQAYGSRPEDLRVALGPAIAPCCFEVGHEVALTFSASFPGEEGVLITRPGAKPHVHLRQAQRLQLLAAGVLPEHIDASDACTKCDPAGRFYSFRRDAGHTGQHVGFIARGPASAG
jgi:purine-nucleoside/S-methyl-5'-thioadenosine phosphorylase / adenosine deaminase